MTASIDRLGRLLNLVPYLLSRPGIAVADAAGDLGVTERQLREDLQLLWLCGLPGYGPGDLIDMALDGDRVTITYDAGIDRPLRLRPDEALALVVALRLLGETPGMAQREAIDRALAKLERAAGADAGAPVTVGQRGDNDRLEDLRRAVEGRRALRIVYYTASRDATAERVVDPMRVLVVGGRAYLEAWCRQAGAVRLFRVDRVDGCVETGQPSAVPPEAHPVDVRDGVFRSTTDQPLVTLRLARGARWITEYYPCETVTEGPGEHWTVTLRAADLAWATRLVLGIGPDATVLGPPKLATMIADRTRAALASYGVDR
ncbi:MAG: WYL domain-containing protein [Micromonosporaceae bacterium]|nr:WYL domain-containing protein [Micromonosporaceae bacterium]